MIHSTTRLRRDWLQAIKKLEREGRCRVCGSERGLQVAHVIGRKCDPIMQGPRGGEYRYVHPDSIVPLCGGNALNKCHEEYDARKLDLLPYLHVHEQTRAVEDAGGVMSMLRRVSPMGGTW